jgi:hypothetical protein
VPNLVGDLARFLFPGHIPDLALVGGEGEDGRLCEGRVTSVKKPCGHEGISPEEDLKTPKGIDPLVLLPMRGGHQRATRDSRAGGREHPEGAEG